MLQDNKFFQDFFLRGVTILSALIFSSACFASDQTTDVQGVGVVLGGGGARGFAHLGVLKELDRLHIPVACIAGTSAGALIGGMYANGLSLDKMQQAFKEADWDQMLSGKPDRSVVSYDRKRDDYRNFFDVTFGIKDGGVRAPKSAINSQQIEMFIRRLTHDRSGVFDNLPIPFRAVATDLSSGDRVVFDKGALDIALRASMAVPGVFDWVQYDGHLLVDGGLAENIPVDQVKGRCASRVIVVSVGTPLMKKDEIQSLFDVVAQTSNIMVARNEREQMKLLDTGDVVISPDLTGFSAVSFDQNQAIIQRGEQAARKMDDVLKPFSVSDEAYAKWKSRLTLPDYPPVDEVKVKGEINHVDEKSLTSALTNKGKSTTVDVISSQINQIFAQGDYDSLGYELSSESGKNILTVWPQERSTGQDSLRFGMNLQSATPGDTGFTFLVAHQKTWINSAGGVWRNNLSVGSNRLVKSELYQPLYYNSSVFVSPSVSYSEDLQPYYNPNHVKYAELTNRHVKLTADLGYALGQYGEVRAGVYRSQDSSSVSLGSVNNIEASQDTDTGVHTSVVIDQFDNPRWPRRGYFLSGEVTQAMTALGSTSNSQFYNVVGEASKTVGDITLRFTTKFKGNFNRADNDYRFQSLGGFLNLTGYQQSELQGTRVAFGRLMVYWRAASLPSVIGSGLYAGMSLETGKVWGELQTSRNTDWIPAGSLFLGADTILGPFFLGIGNAQGGRLTGYMYLGVDY